MAGSDLNTVDKSEMTPLLWAIFYGNFDLAKLLIELGADPVKEINGATAVHYAFGKPFSRRGPVVKKAMEALWDQLVRLVGTVPPIDRDGEWHPLLSTALDTYLRQSKYTTPDRRQSSSRSPARSTLS
ncbi:hypothetical protein GGR51DRAFT_539814 [Nemania sp. FL0031]|nr:hypothetical protein GGR51DRAFT_539814 [Nemania sp. FL0031]